MTAPELFYKFLVNQGILFKFIQILNSEEHKTFTEYCNSIEDPINYIFAGFRSAQTTYGKDKDWTKICDSWQQIWIEETSK